jgi:hypothetical protein
VGDFGWDPVLRNAKLVSFGNITQVDTAYQLDTARRRYDNTTQMWYQNQSNKKYNATDAQVFASEV